MTWEEGRCLQLHLDPWGSGRDEQDGFWEEGALAPLVQQLVRAESLFLWGRGISGKDLFGIKLERRPIPLKEFPVTAIHPFLPDLGRELREGSHEEEWLLAGAPRGDTWKVQAAVGRDKWTGEAGEDQACCLLLGTC